MELIIRRRFEPKAGAQYSTPYRAYFNLKLTEEEQTLIATYGLEDHILTQSKYSITTVGDVIRGASEMVGSLNVLIGNENALRSACAELPAMLDYCRTFGSELNIALP
jgi:hypothetical protein